jgi:tryptophan-rich sensory protein
MEINWLLLIGLIIACNLIGASGALLGASDGDWYRNIKKPSFNPPSWIFGPVWTLLFTLMGVALYLVWTSPSSKIRTVALILFAVQFVFNVLWSYLFFGINKPGIAFAEILIMLGFIIATTVYFFKINKISGYLLIPYILWVSFASFLNFSIWRLNA